jgi:capsular exopolysaccharide synthesis family protein
LRRRWLLAACCGVLCGAVVSAAAWFLVPTPKHMVRTKLRVPPGEPFLFKTAEQVPDLMSHQRNQIALVKSRLVLNSALRDPKLAKIQWDVGNPDAVEWLEKEVKADFLEAPEVLRISMDGLNTDELVLLVNAIREAYLKEVIDKEGVIRRGRLAKLAELRMEKQRELDARKEDSEREIKAKLVAKDPIVRSREQEFVQQQLGMIERELLMAQSERRQTQLALEDLQAKEKKFPQPEVRETQVQDVIAKDRVVQRLQDDIQSLQALRDGTIERSARGENDPAVGQYNARLASLNQTLEAKRLKLRPGIVRELRDKAIADRSATISLLQNRIERLENMEKSLTPQVDALRKRVVQLTEGGIKLDEVHDNMSQLVDFTKRIRAEEEALKIELQVPSKVSVLEEAVVSRVNAQRRQLLTVSLVGLGGFAFGLFAVSWLEYRARRVDTANEVVNGLGVNLVGALPDSSAVSRRLFGRRVAPDAAARSLLTESVDAARALLLHMARQESLRVVMVTSAVGGEGKTSLVSHLAASMARAGLKTLLIDGDLRNPTAHLLFDVPGEAGFSEALRGEIDAASATHPSALPGLSVLPAGKWDDRAAQALSLGRAGTILDRLRQEYDFILLDSSPVLPVADALLLGQHADGILVSVLCQVSRMVSLFAALQRVQALGLRTLGVVVNGVRGDPCYSLYPDLAGTRATV